VPNGRELKQRLIENKVFVPTYWPNSFIKNPAGSWEEYLATNLVALPIDQRYRAVEMEEIIRFIETIV
jgi:hypothetical protein